MHRVWFCLIGMLSICPEQRTSAPPRQKFSQLNVAVTGARTERVEKETLYKQLVALQASGAPLDTFPPILQNSFIQGLKAELAGLQRDRLLDDGPTENANKTITSQFVKEKCIVRHARCDVYCGARRDGW